MVQSSNLAVVRVLPVARPLSAATWYVLVSAALFGLWIGYYLHDPFGFDIPSRDTWHHVAVLRELMASPFSPGNPHIPTNEPSRYYTPLNVLAALVGRAMAVSPYRLFGAMGAASCLGFIAGCWVFARRYYQSPWAPLYLMVTLLFAWGIQMGHAGLHSYETFLSSAAYPSTIALVLGLFSWALALRVTSADGVRASHLLALSALAAVILLTHQLSGVIVLAGTGSLILFADQAPLRLKVDALAAIAVGCAATLAWPYFSIVEVLASAQDDRWRSATQEINKLSTSLALMMPVTLGVLGYRRIAGGLRWELLAPFAAFALGFVVLTATGSAIAHRFPPAVVLYGQLGLVWVILGLVNRAPRERTTTLALAVMAGLVALVGVNSGLKRMQDLAFRESEGSLRLMAQDIAGRMPVGAIAFASDSIVFPLQSTGRRVVSIPRPEPVAPSLIERQAATDRFFAERTSNIERRQLIDRWHATHVVMSDGDLEPEVVHDVRLLGAATRFGRGVELIALAAPAQNIAEPRR